MGSQWYTATGHYEAMKAARIKTQQTLKSDYANSDELFKEQLIKTKVSFS